MRLLLLVLCAGSVGCAGAPRVPVPPPMAFIGSYSGTACVEVVHVRPTSPEVAARLLPDAYLLHLVTSVLPLAAALAPLSDAIEVARDAAIDVGHGTPGDRTVVRGRVQLDYSSQLRPRSTGTITVRSDGVETSGPGAYLRFDSTVRVVR